MAIKRLQNNFTTPEQSKQLLELGVPADSADLYYQDYGSIPMVVWTLTQPRDLRRGWLKPCWSVGRLIEIINNCMYDIDKRDKFYAKLYYHQNDLFSFIMSTLKYNEFDFSKLED